MELIVLGIEQGTSRLVRESRGEPFDAEAEDGNDQIQPHLAVGDLQDRVQIGTDFLVGERHDQCRSARPGRDGREAALLERREQGEHA